MTATPPSPETLSAAVTAFVDLWAEIGLISQISEGITCSEVDALARLFEVTGRPQGALAWLRAHVAADVECEGHPGAAATGTRR